MKLFILLPVFFIVPILHAKLEISDFKEDWDIELELVGAAHNGTPVRFDGQSNGEFIAWTPYATALSREIGLLEFFQTQGTATLKEEILSGKLTVKLPPPGPEHRRGELISQTFEINGKVERDMITGTWASGSETGILHGYTEHSLLVEHLGSGTVTLDCAYPFPGREGSIGYQGLQARLGSAFTIKDGTITSGSVGPNGPRTSWYPDQSFRLANWILPTYAENVSFCAHGYEHKAGNVSGSFDGENLLNVRMQSKVERQAEPVIWDIQLKRYGRIWVGKWNWKISAGKKDISRWAAARLRFKVIWPLHCPSPNPKPKNPTPKEYLLEHAYALMRHPSNVIWRDDLLAMVVKGTGNKQYDNPPNNVGAAILTGLLVAKLSDDPKVKAEGRAMARRAAYWWTLARYGPLQLGEYYKGMFWCTSWAGFGLAELTEADPDGPWNQWATELAKSIQQVQLPSGAWTWVDEGDASLGRANYRNDRSCDNRELNCGDVLLALSMLSDALDLDLKDSEKRGKSFLSKTLASPPEWFFQDRRPGDTPETLGTVCYFQWLVEQQELDLEEIAKVRKLIDSQFFHPEAPKFLKGYMPRWTPGHSEGPAIDLSATARYANALATLGKRHSDTSATDRAKELVGAIFQKASGAESGLMDYLGRKLPSDPNALGQADAHSYLCLKAALGWELLEALEKLD